MSKAANMDYHKVLALVKNYGRPMILHFSETVADIEGVVKVTYKFDAEGKLGIKWRHRDGHRPVVSSVVAKSQVSA